MDNTKSTVTRRGLFRYGALTVLSAAAAPLFHLGSAHAQSEVCNPDAPTNPQDALAALVAGNNRWATGTQTHPGEDKTTLDCLANNPQTPFASILTCSDSRTPPELIFDQGPGNLFVARVAGNTANGFNDTLLFGTRNLGSTLAFVMGHSSCGAVIAAVNACINKQHVCKPNPELAFVDLIHPAVKQAQKIVKRQGGDPEDPTQVVPVATVQNVILAAATLRVKLARKTPGVLVSGGVYDLGTQLVTVVA